MPAAKAARTGPERAVPAGGPARKREELAEDVLPEEVEEDLPEETPLEDEETDADFFEKAEETPDDDEFRRP
jgi:hypothetical protein